MIKRCKVKEIYKNIIICDKCGQQMIMQGLLPTNTTLVVFKCSNTNCNHCEYIEQSKLPRDTEYVLEEE